MKRIAGFALLLAVSAFGQEFRLEKADGSSVSIPAVAPPLDSVIVEFRDAPAALSKTGDYRAAFARFRADLTSVSRKAEVRREYFRVFNGASVRVPRADLAAIARLPYVKQIHADHEMHTMAGPAVSQINADVVWTDYGTRGQGVVVAIIDTGIDYNHEALGKGFGPGFKVVGGYDFANNDADPMDDHGHGTHVAGIIAGDSATITGVAPDATLMAFKALRSTGSGSESDVVAAIERAADPNDDGDTRDHVDVVNLSLGGGGGPDDAASRAVDAGSQLGIVFCIAAGNAGKYHTVSSPGTARQAITVGAVDSTDIVAGFSSRGPTPSDLTMKPEVAAPGVLITSSFPGNRYVAESGTSMATPHVAGACALLKAVHRDWTPAQIKAALMLNGLPKNQDAMSIGAGRIDAAAAAGSPLAINRASIDFGLDPVQQATWSASRTVHVTNRSDQSTTWNLSASTSLGVTPNLAPPALTLAPGATGDFTLSIAVDNTVATVGASSFSGGGAITLSSSNGTTLHMPWTFVKAVRATVKWEKEFATVLWLDGARSLFFDAAPLDANVSETLLAKAGEYDVIIFGSSVDAKTDALTRATFIYLEHQHLDGDVIINATEAQGKHVIRGATTTPDGKPLQLSPDQTYALLGRLVWPAGTSTFASLTIPPLPLRELHVNDIAEANALFLDEAYVDFIGKAIYAIQHPRLDGVKGDVTLAAVNVKSAPVQLLFPSSPRDERRIAVQVVPTAGASAFVAMRAITDSAWNGHVFLTPDVDSKYSAGMTFAVVTDGVTRYTTPLLHMLAGDITTGVNGSPPRYDSGAFIFGAGPRLAVASFTNVNGLLHPSMFVDMFGSHGESRVGDRTTTTVVTFGADGKQKASVALYPAPLDIGAKGKYTLEATNNATQYPDLPQQTKLTMSLDSSRADYLPPTLTGIYLVDGAGNAARVAPARSAAALYFSAADYAYTPFKTYQQIRAEATTLSYRYAGATSWNKLGLTQIAEDPSAGFVYRADLSGVTNVDWARVDLKIDIEDNAGNTTSVVMQPAFAVGSEYPARRRAAP